jgi:hypothetical protein
MISCHLNTLCEVHTYPLKKTGKECTRLTVWLISPAILLLSLLMRFPVPCAHGCQTIPCAGSGEDNGMLISLRSLFFVNLFFELCFALLKKYHIFLL